MYPFIFFHCTACGILVPRPGTEPGPWQWKCRVLTTGPPRIPLIHFHFASSACSVGVNGWRKRSESLGHRIQRTSGLAQKSLLCGKGSLVPLVAQMVKNLPAMQEWNQMKSLSRVRLFVTTWTVAYQAPPPMGLSRQEYWSGLPFPFPGDLPNPGIKPKSPALQAYEPPRKQCRRTEFNPGVRKIPWIIEWLPILVFLTSESHGQRSLVGLQSMGSQRVGQDWATFTFHMSCCLFTGPSLCACMERKRDV